SFDDGGSSVKLHALPLSLGGKSFDIDGVIGGSSQLTKGQDAAADKLTLEYTGLRVINVENFGGDKGGAIDPRKVDLRESINSRMGAANKSAVKKELRNVGPSISYKLRDAAGQAREFHNYMLPVQFDDAGAVPVFLMGVRETPSEPFRYLRMPADEQGLTDGFLRLRDALADSALREQAVARYAVRAVDTARPELASQLGASASRALALFAGVGVTPKAGQTTAGGLQAISDFMEGNVPAPERERAGELMVRILNGALFELLQITRERAGLKPLDTSPTTQAFMAQAVLALSDAQHYPAPMIFTLKDFTQVQASVFQVARAPGRNIVYLGCALLILGVFAMLYVRERRLWVWLAPADQGTQATMALSSNRKTMDGDREFDQLKLRLIGAKEG
ncbi:MAG: cytochrome c biogenesis protein ResB, partial [Burkholderiaceae bacterium]|nr:cytochrome c biogenesis protein ResB [Burkholderiaceae bacterium]